MKVSWAATVPTIAPEKVTTKFRVRIMFPSTIRAVVVVMELAVAVPVPVVGVAACAIGNKSKAMGRRNNALAIFIFFTFRIFRARSLSIKQFRYLRVEIETSGISERSTSQLMR